MILLLNIHGMNQKSKSIKKRRTDATTKKERQKYKKGKTQLQKRKDRQRQKYKKGKTNKNAIESLKQMLFKDSHLHRSDKENE